MYNIERLREMIEVGIKNIDFPAEPQGLYDPIKYSLSNGGKRLRPVLLLISCNIFNDRIEKAINPAIGIEVFHNFTLLHDDIMDNASLRRGKETVHKKWNENTAILSGDAMMIMANQLIAGCKQEILGDVFTVFNDTALKVCEGQQYDMNFENLQNVSLDEYMIMIELKTSALLAASLQIGAIIGGASHMNILLMHEIGKNLGFAFQLQDDLLDVYGDKTAFGKQPGGDIVSNKKTFLLLSAMNILDKEEKTILEKELYKKDFDPDEKIEKVISIYNKLNIKKITENKIEHFHSIAIQKLGQLDIEVHRLEILKELIEKLLKRES